MPPPRKKKWNKKRLAILVISGVAIILSLLLADRRTEPPPVAIIPPEQPAPKVVDCKTYPFKHYSKKLNDRLPEYRHLSLKAGVPPIHDEKVLASLIANGRTRIVPVQSDHTFEVAEMKHGRPYLTPKAYQMLRSIAREFNSRLKGTDLEGARLKVTSLFRTLKDQKDLGRSNVNATKSAEAPHTHGTSIDISYMKFVSSEGEQLQLAGCQQVFLAETLAEVIEEHRKKDKLLFATRERQQACYHLSVCS